MQNDNINVLIAIPYKIKDHEEWEKILNNFDERSYYIYEINGIDSDNFDLGSLAGVIEYYKNEHENINKIVVLSNARDLIFAWYRCYNSLVSDYILYNENETYHYFTLDNEHFSFYYNIYEFYGINQEKIVGRVFVTQPLNGIEPVFFNEKYFDSIENFNYYMSLQRKPINKKYKFNGAEYCFNVDDSTNEECLVNLDQYSGAYKKENVSIKIADKFKRFKIYCTQYNTLNANDFNYVTNILSDLDKEMIKLSVDDKKVLVFILRNELFKTNNCDKYKILITSVLLFLTNDAYYLELIWSIVLNSIELTKYEKFFAYYQCIRKQFLNLKNDLKMMKLRNALYDHLYYEFKPADLVLKQINKTERNHDCVFVFASQITNIHHSPTKIAFDICACLAGKMNKTVYLINTNEVLTSKGCFPLRGVFLGIGSKDYLKISKIKYHESVFSVYQPIVSMPDDNEIRKILQLVYDHKPGLIFNLGAVLVGDLCSEFVPTVSLPLAVDDYTKSTFIVNFNEAMFVEYGDKFGRNKDNTFMVQGAFELKPKVSSFSRTELGIPEDKFAILVVGNRLDEEIDEAFLHVLNYACESLNGFVLFIGGYEIDKIVNMEYLKKNCNTLSYQDDLLSVVENVDLYINPKRNGGGTSAIYALYAGKPVLTLEHGDVYHHAGEIFAVKNYEAMNLMIERYANDLVYYKEKSKEAQKRGEILTSFEQYIGNVYKKAIQSKLYF